MIEDIYKTIAIPSKEILYKDRKSKFFGRSFPISAEEDVKLIIEKLRKKYQTAGHICYAWQLGVSEISYRANDDGEPNNSAGMPIYGQIKAFELTNVLVAVPRVFGGTKLGVGGLIQAYKATAQLTLEESTIIEKFISVEFEIKFEYKNLDKVMRLIKQLDLIIKQQKMELSCSIIIIARKSLEEKIFKIFQELHEISFKKLEG
ncbi:YigZ family protein [Croceitalea sp. P059]|uniref:IMPACT family protein n=1 Tax=Croceitalea sp. P059 TaxID=3075601 RepID=UPI002886D9B5|nr:YigZ family protein [Croceitalea sp. P059]MDT0539996.1 YigZ family protein [Croceitalea sp. P059]